MAVSDILKAAAPMAIRTALEKLDRSDDSGCREVMLGLLRKLVVEKGLPKPRMRRLATLLSEASAEWAEELK